MLNMFNTKYYMKYNSQYSISCCLLSFLNNFKLKTEVTIDLKVLLVTELNRSGVIGLLYILLFHKVILPSHW